MKKRAGLIKASYGGALGEEEKKKMEEENGWEERTWEERGEYDGWNALGKEGKEAR